MLFDLRGRGRRRAVQGIYLALALLMGGGLVLFGIGGNTNGGIVDALTGSGSGGGSGNPFADRVKAAELRTQKTPKDAAAWAALARLRFQDASSGGGYDDSTSSFTPAGKRELGQVSQAWDRHLALHPAKPDANTALLMVQVFGPTGLAKPADAVKALEVVIDQRPPVAGTYVQYAQLAYAAGQSRKGDLASARAVSLTPKAQRASLKDTLNSFKAAAAGAGGAAPATPPATTTG